MAARLGDANGSGRALLDLTESDPSRCGLAWDAEELAALLGDEGGSAAAGAPATALAAREAVASYLAGKGASVDPDRVFLAASRGDAFRLALGALCAAGDEILVPSPGPPSLETVEPVRLRRYALQYDGVWRLDRRALAKAAGGRARVVVVGNPSEPTGAMLLEDDLEFLQDLCSAGGATLVADEGSIDSATAPCPSVAKARRCLALHVSGLSGVCGLPHLGAEWLAVSGPDELAAPVVARLRQVSDARPPVGERARRAIPALLARRERFLAPLRARIAGNRAYLAAAALREAPWSLQWGSGGHRAVLQIGAAHEEESLCGALLDDGVVVQPGASYLLPADGYLVVSLLPTLDVFREGLALLDRRLRAPHPSTRPSR